MSELTLFVLQLALLALLWLFVLLSVAVMRRDLFGARAERKAAAAAVPAAAAAAPASAATPKAKPAKAPRGAPRSLVVTAGSGPGRTLALGTTALTIGRGPDNTLVVDDDTASTHHCRLVPGATGWTLEDLGSTNGTFLGKNRVTAPVAVKAGSAITVGRTILELRK